MVSKKEDKIPNPEVKDKPKRRFTLEYKLKILREVEECREERGAIGKLLRREGLYWGQLSRWRKKYQAGIQKALGEQKVGRKEKPVDPSAEKLKKLEKENEKLKKELKQAQTIIEVQKKISELLQKED